VADETDYEKAVSLIGAAPQAGPGQVTIDLGTVLADKIGIRRADYSEVAGLLESLEAKQAGETGDITSKLGVQKNVERGKRIFGKGVSGAESGFGRAASLFGKGFGESSRGIEIAAGAARGLGRAAKSVEKEFAEAVRRNPPKVGPAGLVLPRLSLQDQLSELEKIGAGIDGGAFSADQMRTIANEIAGLDAAVSKEDASSAPEDLKEPIALRASRLRDIKGKLNIK
jgi:hypothetical protein